MLRILLLTSHCVGSLQWPRRGDLLGTNIISLFYLFSAHFYSPLWETTYFSAHISLRECHIKHTFGPRELFFLISRKRLTQHMQQATHQNIRNDHSGIPRYIDRCDLLTPWAQFGLLSKKILRWSSVRVDTNNLGPEIPVSCDGQANDLGACGCRHHPQACPRVEAFAIANTTLQRTRRMASVQTPKNRM